MQAKATFAAGCFWGVEHTFNALPGVISTCVGYTGGHTENPSYQQVCHDDTGHAEAVQVTFDPKATSFEALLNTFWQCHNPTLINRQGPDVGSQYRSAIFYHSDAQKTAAIAAKNALEQSGAYSEPIATEITQAGPFYKAEEYHQKYVEKHGGGHCNL